MFNMLLKRVQQLSINRILVLGFSVSFVITVFFCMTFFWFSQMIQRAQNNAKNTQDKTVASFLDSRNTEKWIMVLNYTEADLNQRISRLYQNLLRNEKTVTEFTEESDPLNSLLQNPELSDLQQKYPESAKHVEKLRRFHQQILQEQKRVDDIWQQSHEGLAEKLHDVRRTMIYWTLKVANMLFVQSSIDELLFETAEDTPLLQLQQNPMFVEYARSMTELTTMMDKVKPLNQKLWRAANDLDMHIIMYEWDKARKLYRDVFPPATKSIGVYLDDVIRKEEQILAAQTEAREILNRHLVPTIQESIVELSELRLKLNRILQPQQQKVSIQTGEMEKAWEHMDSTVKGIKWMVLVLTVFSAISSMIFIHWVSDRIIRPINGLSSITKAISKGDLRRNQLPNARKDEIGQLITSVNEMSGSLHHLVSQFSITMNDVAGTAEQISVASKQTAVGMNEQTAFVSDIQQQISHISQSAMEFEHRIEEVTRQSKSAEETAREGINTVNDALSKMSIIQEVFIRTSESIRQLHESTLQIQQIMSIIEDIAKKSKILSVNAAIEAARAGKAGKGFMVITSEIKALSEQTLEATKSVENFIGEIEMKTENAVTLSQKGVDSVIEGVALSKTAQDSLELIIQSSESVVAMIRSTTETASSQALQTQQVTQLVEEIHNISNQSNVCANETVGIGVQLNEKSISIQSMLSTFRLN